MRLLFALLLALGGAFAAAPAVADPFPRPAALDPMVEFWKQIYAEVPTDSGLIHDSVHVGVVYERIVVPQNLSRRSRDRRIAKAKKRYAGILRSLGSGKRNGLNAQSQRVLALWPAGVSNETLRGAARRLRFQRGQADKFRDGVIRSGRWREHIHEIFAAHGLPIELSALPHVESSFNPRAYSKVGAAGLWQFTRSTGRRFMTVTSGIDERMDPFIATVAAAKLLKSNLETTGSWPLAITAYNHGAAGMRRAKRRLGTDDISVIVAKYRSRTFGFASRNFYAEFLAALEIDQRPEHYFGVFEYEPPERIETLVLDAYYPGASIAKALGVEVGLLKQLNPSLREAIWTGQRRVPQGFALRVPSSIGRGNATQRLAALPKKERFDRQTRDRYHRVRRGETLSTIARRYGTSQKTLLSLNNLRSRHRIRAGQRLRLPDDPADRVAARQGRAVLVQTAWKGDRYRVRRGETLDSIARRVGSTPKALATANGLRNANRIYVGQTLKVPGGDPAKAIEAPVAPTAVANTEPPKAPAAKMGASAKNASAPPAEAPSTDVAVTRPTATPPEPSRSGAVAEAAEVKDGEGTPESSETATRAASTSESTRVADKGADRAGADPALTPGAQAAPHSDPKTPVADLASGPPVASTLPKTPTMVGSSASGDAEQLLNADPSRWALKGEHITVQPDETLGHYADWLGLETRTLRRLNGMRQRSELTIGRRIRLDFSKVSPDEFNRRRMAHHRALRVAFLEAHAIKGTREHVLRRGETLWEISRSRYGIPLWLLRDYNPNLDFSRLQSGARLQIPDVERRVQNSGTSSDSSVPASPA